MTTTNRENVLSDCLSIEARLIAIKDHASRIQRTGHYEQLESLRWMQDYARGISSQAINLQNDLISMQQEILLHIYTLKA